MKAYVILPAAVGLLGACGQNAARFAAADTGDVSNAPAERGSPTASSAAACGEGGAMTVAGSGAIDRLPYVQKVTSSSADILVTTQEAGAAPLLRLGLPGGEELQSYAAAPDPADASGRQWVVRLSELQAGTTYCYAFEGLSELAGFRTAPLPAQADVVRFVAFGDSGGGDENPRAAVRDQLETLPFDLILHTGDIAYGEGTLAQFEARFFDAYAGLLGSVPVFPVSGNHDYGTDDAAPYRQVFALPENGGPSGLERWYSFDWGNVHFVALDTQRISDAQKQWLQRDLANNELPWTVVYLHRPPFSSGEHGSSLAVRRAFTPIFEAHGVQLVLAGHDHNYERTRAINGVTYVVTGGGGHGTRSVERSSFTAHSEGVLHVVYGEASSEALVLHAIDAVGREFDSVRIERALTPAVQ